MNEMQKWRLKDWKTVLSNLSKNSPPFETFGVDFLTPWCDQFSILIKVTHIIFVKVNLPSGKKSIPIFVKQKKLVFSF